VPSNVATRAPVVRAQLQPVFDGLTDYLDLIESGPSELNARPRKFLGGITPAQAMQRLLFDSEGPIVATTA
jgi:hypothetical protein